MGLATMSWGQYMQENPGQWMSRFDASGGSNTTQGGFTTQGIVGSEGPFTTGTGIAPTYTPPAPYVPPAPYTAPEWNKDEIQNIEQRKAAPGLRAARGALQRVTAGMS